MAEIKKKKYLLDFFSRFSGAANTQPPSSLFELMNSNDSQITLVNPKLGIEPNLLIVLSRDDVKQTVMRRKGNNEVLYRVKSNASRTKTVVSRPLLQGPIAVLELRGIFRRDKVTFRGEERKSINDWMSGYNPFQMHTISFQHERSRYHWRTDIFKQLALFNDQDSVNPIAWFQKSRQRVVEGVLKRFQAVLALEEEAVQLQDLVVISFLVAENKLRRDMRLAAFLEGQSTSRQS